MKKIMRNTIILLVMFVAAVLFTQSKMELHAADTGIAGDANRDSVVDVKDLVRAKRFAKDLQDNVPVEDRIAISADIDLDKDLNINDTDTRYLRVLLIGEYNATVIPDNKDVDVGKYDKADDTFDIAIPKGVELADDARLVSATFQQHAATSTQTFSTLEYADRVATLNNSLLGDRAFDDIQLVFETGSARVDVINIPIDCFAMVINDEAELNRFPIVAQAHPAGYYILGNDIYCEGTYTSNHTEPFTGTFNGMVHTIYNMNVVSGDEWVGGIFGRQLGRDNGVYATVRNLSFVNASYTGNGGFLGTITVADIDNVYIDIAMKQCGTGTYAGATAVIGTNTLGALSLDGVLINYRKPLAAGATTGTAVYEMHNVPNSYKGIYVIGAERMGVTLDSALEKAFVGGAYLTEAEFLAAVSSGEVDLSSWDTGFWKISDGEVPIPVSLAPYADAYLDEGVLADYAETAYKNNVGLGRVVQTGPKKVEVLNNYTDGAETTEEGVLKITGIKNENNQFDFSLRFGKKIAYSAVESISIRIAHTNINSPGNQMQTFFTSTNRSDVDIYGPETGLYKTFEVPENTWATITIPKNVLAWAKDDAGYISELSIHCNYGPINPDLPLTVYVDEITYAPSQETKIGVISDMHFASSGNGQREVNFRRALTYYKEQGADVIIMNGDVSDLGTVESYGELVRVIDEVYPAEEKRPTFLSTADSHEYYDAWSWRGGTGNYAETQSRFLTNFANKLDQESLNTHEVVNGYHVIGISSDTSEAIGPEGKKVNGLAGYSADTVQWFENALKAASAEDATKPIFVALHQPPRYTVTASTILANGNEALTAILAQYPQAIVFTSHTHSSIKQENSIYQKDFTVVNTGSLFYIGGDEMGYVNTGNTADYLLHAYNFAEGLLVTVSGNEVNIERRDFFNQEKIKTDWVIKEPSNKSSFTYTDARKETRVAPTFAEGTTMTVEKHSQDSVVLKFPSAVHEDFVQYYTVEVKDEEGNPVQLYRLGTGYAATSPNYVTDFYFGITRMASTQSLVVKGLSAGVRYTFKVCAVETFGNASSPLTATYTYNAVDETIEVPEVQYVGLSTYQKATDGIQVSKATQVTLDLSAYANQIQGEPVEATNETLGGAITVDGTSQGTKVVLSTTGLGSQYGTQKLAIYFAQKENGAVVKYTKVSVNVLLCTYVLKTADDLDAFGALSKAESASPGVWAGHFVLGNDIAYNKQFTPFITRETVNSATASIGSTPWANWTDVVSYGFKGVFDGLGHTIEGLEIIGQATWSNNAGEPDACGFIGLLNNTGVIRNVAFTNASFTGAGNQGGGFISYASNGTMENIYVSYARLANAGTGNVGTFIGVDSRAAARIKNCYVDLTKATVSGSNIWAIGRVHEGYGVVSRVYVTGSTSAIKNLSSASGAANIYGAYATRAEMKNANIAITAANGWNMNYWTTDADGLPIFK